MNPNSPRGFTLSGAIQDEYLLFVKVWKDTLANNPEQQQK